MFYVFAVAAVVGTGLLWWLPKVMLERLARQSGLSHTQAVQAGLWALLSWPGYLIFRRKLGTRPKSDRVGADTDRG